MPTPGEPTPALRLPTLDHGDFDLDGSGGTLGTLLVFYRGLHCPICMGQLGALEEHLDAFERLGVSVAGASADGAERSRATAETAGVARLPLAHSLPLETARQDWGLYISAARAGSEEPAHFNEPGVFYVRPTRVLHFAWVQSTPLARPRVEDLFAAIKFAKDNDYPPRGTIAGPLPDAA